MNFFPPSPLPPSRREGGDFWFISPGATAPGTPAPEPGRHRNRGGVSCAKRGRGRGRGGLPWGRARTPDCISNSFGKVLGGLGASFKKPPNASLPWCPAGRVCHGASANAGLHQQFIREKFLGVWGLLSRSPQRFFVSSFLRIFSVIPHLRSADSMT